MLLKNYFKKCNEEYGERMKEPSPQSTEISGEINLQSCIIQYLQHGNLFNVTEEM